ncbi:MAG TPA: PTS sugar transporter subunit IIA [Planctomycetota bacterium]|nr:PTS sugar transporter subunit IIA [Planctomycetota bacterium]
MPSSESPALGFARQFKSKACSVSLEASTKEGCLSELAELLVSSGGVPARQSSALEAAFLERERMATTGVGSGVAIPHVKLAGIERTALAFAVHKQGVPWAAVDGEPAHLFFAVVRPAAASELHDPRRHLELMQWIAKLARVRDFRRFALAAANKTELFELLEEAARA